MKAGYEKLLNSRETNQKYPDFPVYFKNCKKI